MPRLTARGGNGPKRLTRLSVFLFAGSVLLGASGGLVAAPSVEETAALPVIEAPLEAPFRNYSRPRPEIATAGTLGEGGLKKAEALGFKVVIDLRTGMEPGVKAQEKEAQELGLSLIRMPMWRLPSEAQVADFAALYQAADNRPILVHCMAADRVGALWALYRVAYEDADPQLAYEEGVAIGLHWYKGAVRKKLGL